MEQLVRKYGLVLALKYCLTLISYSQTVSSISNGDWNDHATWGGGVVPNVKNASTIRIDHEVTLTGPMTIDVPDVIVNGRLTLRSGAVINLNSPSYQFRVAGTLENHDSTRLTSTSSANLLFDSGSQYIHKQGPLGFIPYATWNPNSTFQISGFTNSGYINIAHGDSWKQNFGRVVFDCPNQSIFVVDLNGYLRNVAGDLVIRNTNGKTLRLSTTQSPIIQIGADLIVEGNSEMWLSTNGAACVVNVARDFIYRSTSTGPSYLTTRGNAQLNIGRHLEVNSSGPLRMASSASDSTGTRQASIRISGNVTLVSGTILAPPAGSGTGRIVFQGTGTQTVTASATGSSFAGNIDYIIEASSKTELGNSVLSSTSGSFTLRGILAAASTDRGGSIQLSKKGNLQIPGPRIYESGSSIEYNADAPQWIGDGHPKSGSVNLVCNNPTTISLAADALVGGNFLLARGGLETAPYQLKIQGNAQFSDDIKELPCTVTLIGNRDQQISSNNLTLRNLTFDKTGTHTVTLVGSLSIRGSLGILSENTSLYSNGNLTLLSTDDEGTGDAAVPFLPAGSFIEGDVTVQRFISGHGKVYRYIASPVNGANVSSLMDDFPVTGQFADPSVLAGMDARTPSLFHYNESSNSLPGGWRPYPAGGLAVESPLQPGLGYAALIRNGNNPTLIDFTGRLNQGDIRMPVNFTPNNSPANGWNLVGNPYPSTIDWDNIGWTKQNISAVIAIRDNDAHKFHYWDGDINYSDIPEGRIACGQSFWVRATGMSPELIARETVKTETVASFYREMPKPIPSFALSVSFGSATDIVFFKVRKDASDSLDNWDAIKIPNDHFNIGIRASGKLLAISARETMPCGNESFDVEIEGMHMGEFHLQLTTKHDLAHYYYIWKDHFLNRLDTLSTEKPFTFFVTEDPKSQATNRFVLVLQESPQDEVQVMLPATVCLSDSISIGIKGGRLGIYYSILSDEGERVSEEVLSPGNDFQIRFRSSIEGDVRLWLHARSQCGGMNITDVQIKVGQLPEIRVHDVTACYGESVALQVISPSESVTYSWFETAESIDTLAKGPRFITPHIKKPRQYFVCGTTLDGCSTEIIPVVINVAVSGDFNSQLGGPVAPTPLTDNPAYFSKGRYTSSVEAIDENSNFNDKSPLSLGCLWDGLKSKKNDQKRSHVSLWPNPACSKINIVANSILKGVKILNTSGQLMRQPQWEILDAQEGWSIEISTFAAGVYMAIIETDDGAHAVKFIKK
ncbi:MAG: T9SS type A sorting domain-containing protein [Chryseolinea sp.]